MPKDRSLVRASDIGAWAFCNRAWWLANVADASHENPSVLEAGNRTHAAHWRLLSRGFWLQRAGLVLLSLGLILGGMLLLVSILGH